MNKATKIIIFCLLTTLFILGGFGLDLIYFSYVAILVLSLILIFLVSKHELVFPPRLKPFVLFLAFNLVSIFWSVNPITSYGYFLLFLSALLIWVVFYNLGHEGIISDQKTFFYFICLLGLVFGLLFVFKPNPFNIKHGEFSLYFYSTLPNRHSHIGDLWAMILASTFYFYTKSKKRSYPPLFIMGAIFMFFSKSRSAIVSFISGLGFIVQKLGLHKNFTKLIGISIGLMISLFLVFGIGKSTLFTRPYYLQSIVGIFKEPFGVGMGNFLVISYSLKNLLPGMSTTSSLAHNLILEIVAGMGIFSAVFIVWFIKIHYIVLAKAKVNNILFSLVFLTLSVNFMFDITYFIPTTLWLWFASLGLAQAQKG
ncbi:hypothetical protein A3H19_04180 [Candidatus Woesebacteria bacterium RIFCSPLOWO2_12_FULL_39_9]|nr:MAG: hypothetical protein A3H19_04180 [Candidatus Woesebacteria bacterium RIFCSPLOWO2_12_FULL_39_9]